MLCLLVIQCYLSFITVRKFLYSVSHQECSMRSTRQTSEWIPAACIWSRRGAHIGKLPVPSTFQADWHAAEDLST